MSRGLLYGEPGLPLEGAGWVNRDLIGLDFIRYQGSFSSKFKQPSLMKKVYSLEWEAG